MYIHGMLLFTRQIQ